MRMHLGRFTRLTNAFSKKIENHAHAVALHFVYYNFCRIHSKLRMTPAMAAGFSSQLCEVSDNVALLGATEAKPAKRDPYKKPLRFQTNPLPAIDIRYTDSRAMLDLLSGSSCRKIIV